MEKLKTFRRWEIVHFSFSSTLLTAYSATYTGNITKTDIMGAPTLGEERRADEQAKAKERKKIKQLIVLRMQLSKIK